MYNIKYLDMFRAILCSSSGGQYCIFTASGIVTLCERPYSAPVESGHVELFNAIHILQNKGILHQLVIKTSLYYDARPEKHETLSVSLHNFQSPNTLQVFLELSVPLKCLLTCYFLFL
jgi:hypothetical protein